MLVVLIYLVFAVILLLSYTRTIGKQHALFLLLIAVFVVSFLKEGMPDQVAYELIYKSTSFSDFGFPYYTSGGSSGREFAFATLISLFKQFNLRHEIFFATLAVLSVWIKLEFFKRVTDNFELSSLLYFSSLYWFADLSVLRHGLIIGLSLWCFYFVYKKTYIKYGLVLLLGIGVHMAFIVMLFVPLLMRLFKYRTLFLPLLFSVLIAGYGINLSEPVYLMLSYFTITSSTDYLLLEDSSIPFNVYNAVLLLLFLLFMTHYSRLKLIPEVQMLAVPFGFGLLLYFMFNYAPTIGGRMLDLFTVSSLMVLVPTLFQNIKIAEIRQVSTYATIVFSIFFFYASSRDAFKYLSLWALTSI